MYPFYVVRDNQVSHNEGPRTMRATACGGLVGRHPVEAGTQQEASARSANARLGISGLQAGEDVKAPPLDTCIAAPSALENLPPES